MKAFTLTPDLNITAYASRKAALASGHASFGSADELDSLLTSLNIKPVDLWNSLPGVTPTKKFMNRKAGMTRILKQIDGLEAQPEVIEAAPAKPAKAKKAKAEQAKADKKAPVAAETAHTPREGSKGAEVADLLKRAEGATLTEIMELTGWQKHTVRGFIAGAAKKKLGLNIESFKSESGDRTYRVVAA